MLLTQSTRPIIGWIATLLGYIMEFIFRGLSSVGIQNIGLCIIIFTFIVRTLMIPLTIKQQKMTKLNSVMQPELAKIQKKYRNRRDPASMEKQNKEMQAVYDKYGFSPTGGCLQTLVQFPIFLALYQVIRKIPAYIPAVKASYVTIVNEISKSPDYITKINKIVDGMKSSYAVSVPKGGTTNQVIDALGSFTASAWTQLEQAFPAAVDTIPNVSSEIIHMNDFAFGINVAQVPGFRLSIYLIIPVLAALFQYLAAKTMQQPDMDDSNPAAGMTKSMTTMMPLFSAYICIITPAGLGIYWVVSNIFQLIQQLVINKYLDKMDMDKFIEKNREIAEKKREKGKKTLMERLTETSQKAEAAKEEYSNKKTMTDIASMNLKKLHSNTGYEGTDGSQFEETDFEGLGEIGKKAYLVAKYEKEHNARGGKK